MVSNKVINFSTLFSLSLNKYCLLQVLDLSFPQVWSSFFAIFLHFTNEKFAHMFSGKEEEFTIEPLLGFIANKMLHGFTPQ